MRYVMGFDGGGTKTDCVLMDGTRAIVARTRSGPSNPTRVGLETAIATLLRATDKALIASGKSPMRAGVAKKVRERIGLRKLRLEHGSSGLWGSAESRCHCRHGFRGDRA